MAFPESILPITVELDLDGTWTDISSDVYERDEIRITRGRADWGQQVDHGRCRFTLNNSSGTYTPRNPSSPYYGQIGRNTPVRVSVDQGDSYMTMNGTALDGASTPDGAALDITGDIDIRCDFTTQQWGSIGIDLAGKYATASDQRSWAVFVNPSGTLGIVWSPDGTLASRVNASSTEAVDAPASGRLAVRVTIDVDNGSGGYDLTFYSADSIDGEWTQLGDTVVGGSTTSIFASTAPLTVGDTANLVSVDMVGKYHAFQLLDGIDGTVVANPDFTAQTPGATSFVDAAGLTWTLTSTSTISNRRVRFVGEISSWPVRWGTGGHDVYVQVEAAGIMRRLGQGAAPLQSTLRRRIPSDPTLLAYWPMEDEGDSSRAASALSNVAAMATTGFDYASVDTLGGSAALPTLDSNSGAQLPMMLGRVPSSDSGEWQVEFVYKRDDPDATLWTHMRILTTGTVRQWFIQMSNTGGRIIGNNSDGSAIVSHSFPWSAGAEPFGDWYRMRFTAVPDGSDVDYGLSWIQVDESGIAVSGTVAGSVGRVTGVASPPDGYASALDGMAIGHVAVFSAVTSTIFDFADHGYNGESAGSRIDRLCGEEDIAVVIHGDADRTELMGPQTPNTVLDLLQECADADHGILYEDRESVALAYRDRYTLYNQGTVLTLDYEGADGLVTPLDPVDDDQLVRNDITVTRADGSSAHARREEGALSVLSPPSGVGRYAEAVTRNLYRDAQTEQAAGWLLHLGTWDETRYPLVKVLLQNAVNMISDAASVDVGDRMQITNPPSWLPPEAIDLLVQGYTEVLHQKRWEVEFNCSPAGPWEVGVRDDPERARRGTAGSELASGVDADDTSLSVATTLGPLWTTAAGDVPFDVVVGGERMTVTAISGTSSPQTFTVTRSVNGVTKAHLAGALVQISKLTVRAL